MSSVFRKLAGLLAVVFLSTTAKAVILDWDTVSWTAGSLSNSYDVDPAKPGNDVTAAVTGDVAQLQPKFGFQTPAVVNGIDGGLSPVEKTLVLELDLANQSQAVTVTISFSALYAQGVNNVSFTIFDVDFSNVAGSTFQDQIRAITALSIDGTTLIAPTITTSANNSLSGTGLNQVVTGDMTAPDAGAGSGAANVTISFGTSAIQSLTFTYGSGAGTVADPTGESIGIHDINFTPVPEINPAFAAAGLCSFAAIVMIRRRKLAQQRDGLQS